MPAATADASSSMAKTCAAIHSPRWPDVTGRCMSRASSASISLRSRSSAAAHARESVSTAGSVPPASALRTHMPRTGSGAAGTAGPCTYRVGCCSRELCRSRTDSNGKPHRGEQPESARTRAYSRPIRDCVRLCTWLRSLCSASSRRMLSCVFSASGSGDHVNAEALGWRIGGVRPTWPAGSARLGTTYVSSAPSAQTHWATISWPNSSGAASIPSTRSAPMLRPAHPHTARRHRRAHDHRGRQRGRALIFPARTRAGSELSGLRLRRGLYQIPHRHSGHG